jgi:hypothetical protein
VSSVSVCVDIFACCVEESRVWCARKLCVQRPHTSLFGRLTVMARVRFSASALREALTHLQHLCALFFAQDERELRSVSRDHTVQRAHILLRARNTSRRVLNVSFSPEELVWNVFPNQSFQLEVSFTARDLCVAFLPIAHHQPAAALATAHERLEDPVVEFDTKRAEAVESVLATWSDLQAPWKAETPCAFVSSWLEGLAPSLQYAYVLQAQLVTERHWVAPLPAIVSCPRPELANDSNALSFDRRWMLELSPPTPAARSCSSSHIADLPCSFQRALCASLSAMRDAKCATHRAQLVSVINHVLVGHLRLRHGVRVAGLSLPPSLSPPQTAATIAGNKNKKRRFEAPEAASSRYALRPTKQAKVADTRALAAEVAEERAVQREVRQSTIRDFFES